MPFIIKRADITKVKADVIVNTANPKPMIGAGTDAAIYQAAGQQELLAEREKLGSIKRGELAVTPAFNLDAKYIFHTVGPRWYGGKRGELDTLRSCYMNCIRKADELGCSSIAFPLISSGSYGVPKAAAVKTAIQTLTEMVLEYDLTVYLLIFSDESLKAARKVYPMIEEEIDGAYVQAALDVEYNLELLKRRFRNLDPLERDYRRGQIDCEEPDGDVIFSELEYEAPIPVPDEASLYKEIAKNLDNLGKDFNDLLFELIIKDGRSQSAIAAEAGIQKQHMTKLLLKDSHPSKKVVFGLCIAFKLDLDESRALLASAGYAIDASNRQDIAFSCLVKYHNASFYNITKINEILDKFGIDCLGTIKY